MFDPARCSERETWPDVMRGILILLVLFHHTAGWGKLLYTPFFMTGFFFLSGYFHSETKPFIPFVVAKIKSLIVPTLTLGFIVLIMLKGVHVFNAEVLFSCYVCGFIFWFLFCLFVAHLIQFCLVRLFGKNQFLLITSAATLGIGVLCFSHQTDVYPWHAQVACVMQPAMMLGYLSRKANWFRIPQCRKIVACGGLAFLYVALFSVAFFVVHMPWCDLMYNNFGNVYFFLPMSLVGTLCLAFFSSIVAEGQKLLSLIGKHTLVIYITHRVFVILTIGGTSILFRDIAQMPWRPVDHTHPGAWAITCILAICIATLAGISISALLQHYAPWALGKFSFPIRKGQR